MNVITLGPEGTFSHQATLKLDDVRTHFANSIDDVFDLLGLNLMEKAVVPLENSLSGTVIQTLDNLLIYDFKIMEELIIPIEHTIASFGQLNKIKKVYAHPHTYDQCKKKLKNKLIDFELILTASNGQSAKMLLEEKDKESAALLSSYAAKFYDIPVIEDEMQEKKNNETRFIVIGHKDCPQTGNDRTSLIVIPEKNEPGLLSSILNILAEKNINLTKLESRPNRHRLGEYLFFIEFTGHALDENVEKALKEIEKISPYKFLGSYARKY